MDFKRYNVSVKMNTYSSSS